MSHPAAATLAVLVIVEPGFGEKLRSVPIGQRVWINMSSTNAPTVRSLWECREAPDHVSGITGFRVDGGVSAQYSLIAELDAIDLHHGPHSPTSPFIEIVVMGAHRTGGVRNGLSHFGFADFTETENGFTARGTPEEAMGLRE